MAKQYIVGFWRYSKMKLRFSEMMDNMVWILKTDDVVHVFFKGLGHEIIEQWLLSEVLADSAGFWGDWAIWHQIGKLLDDAVQNCARICVGFRCPPQKWDAANFLTVLHVLFPKCLMFVNCWCLVMTRCLYQCSCQVVLVVCHKDEVTKPLTQLWPQPVIGPFLSTWTFVVRVGLPLCLSLLLHGCSDAFLQDSSLEA